ncbi:MAG: hypothetical protein PVG14_10095 [Anaerolineales bacterium]|jgi:hypothetical protein
MNEVEKLRVLIPHWIEHNREHEGEFRRWAKQAGEASEDILAAAEDIKDANKALKAALEKLGDPSLQHKHPHGD